MGAIWNGVCVGVVEAKGRWWQPHRSRTRMALSFSSGTTSTSLKELVDQGLGCVPSKYVFPSRQADNNNNISVSYSNLPASLPVIDLAPLSSSQSEARALAIAQIGRACREWGFFQVINHGVSLSLVERLLAAADRFFALPTEERLPYYQDDPRNKREASVNWKETISCGSESSAPAFCLEPALEYKDEVIRLAQVLYRAIVESLGVAPDAEKAKEHMASCNAMMHYYPPCPDPTLTFGLSEHTDAGFITVLLQDQVGGLEIMKDGHWVSCKPVLNSLTINIADQMEILSNGRYRSMLHRVVTNSEKPRLSLPCFLSPPMDGTVCPLPQLIDENNPALYKEVVFRDYVQHYMRVRFADTATSGTDFAKL